MKKNITLLAALSFAGIMASTTAIAAGNQTTVNFKGEVVSAACGIAPESVDQTVQLGQHPTHIFKAKGSSSIPVQFNIKLIECSLDTYTKAKFTFNGSTDATNSELFAVNGGAQGVGVRLSHGGTPIVAGTEATTVELTIDTNVITFSAALEADDDDDAVAGVAEATTTLNIAYL
ncbi:fimbrial protein [Shewanella sp. VB17]|uniref:fimbrial protein n=1 Tax=Shewanella sp. VB17 TaxID=2739432 RepID=UPI001C25996D|nr:fimbrial protein [Shewanella sp. VB17]